mgnify:CR=1 FL=1
MAIPLLALAGFMSAGSSLASSFSQAGAIKAEGIFKSGQYERNAQLAEFNAKEAVRMGETNAQQKAMQVKKLIGKQRATAAAQGIEVNDGSALDFQAEAAGLGALDIVTIRNNAWKQAWGYKVEASNDRANAAMTKISAKYAARSTLITGGMNAASSIMSGFAAGGGGSGGGNAGVNINAGGGGGYSGGMPSGSGVGSGLYMR